MEGATEPMTGTRWLMVLALTLLLSVGTGSAHRMLIGYQIKDLQLNAIYDDGTPAAGVDMEVYKDGELYAEGITDSSGTFLFKPKMGDRIEDLTVVASSVGHRAELSLDPGDEGDSPSGELPLTVKVAAGLGYLVGLAGLSMIYVSRKGR
jgi:nickel transport protein